MSEKASLRELVDLKELQAIQDSFAKTVGTSSVILSPDGEPLTQFSNPTGFCALIQSTEEGKRRCFRSFLEMSQKALELEEPVIQYCFAHGGHFVAPIIIDGEYKGTMFAGQFIPQKFSAEQLKALEKVAVEIHVDPNLLVEEAKKMRLVEEDTVRNYSSLLFQIVEVITRLGAQADELNRAKEALQKAHNGLEIRVQERTAELAKTAEDLRRERERAEEYLNIAGVMLAILDAGENITLINKKGCEILDYKEGELIGRNWFDLLVPQRIRGEIRGVFGKLMAGDIEPVEYYENLLLTKYGEERLIAFHNTVIRDQNDQIKGILFSGEDITERKRAEEELHESEEKVRSIAASAHDAIIMVDNEETISFWNEAAERIFGYSEEEMIGTKLHSAIIPKRFREDALTGFKRFRETGQGAAVEKTLELAAIRKDGTEFPVELSLSSVKLKDKWNGIGIIRDVSEQRKKTEALERFNELAVGRELKMIELKKEINALLEDLGKEPRYKIAGEEEKRNYKLG